MRIGAVSAVNRISYAPGMSNARVKHTQHTQSADIVGKKLQSEIADKQQKKNGLSSNVNIAVKDKASQNIELEQGISSLKAQLRRHQIESGKEQNLPDDNKASAIKEELAKEAEAKAAKEEARKEQIKKAEEESAARKERISEELEASEKTSKDTKALLASDEIKDQAAGQNSVIAKTEAGIAIKKGELRQDKARGENTDKKQEEINSQEKRARFLSNITLGPEGINNGSTGMKNSNYGIQDNNRAIVHEGSDGLVLIKAG